MNTKEKEKMIETQIPRITGLLVIEVRNSNPNGDPENVGFPRQRPDGTGEISPVSVKRKLRELVADKDGDIWKRLKGKLSIANDADFDILETRGRVRKQIIDDMQNGQFEKKYWDARLFGSTFLESREAAEKLAGKLEDKDWHKLQKTIRTGVAHFGVGVSIARVDIRHETWTNKAGVEEGKDRGLAPQALKYVIHGLYTVPFFVNPTQARKTGCEENDVKLMLELLKHAFRDNPSTGRNMVEIRHAHALKHRDTLGSFSDFALIDALMPKRIGAPDTDKDMPSTAIQGQYEIPLWDDIKDKPVRPGKSVTWSEVAEYTDYAL